MYILYLIADMNTYKSPPVCLQVAQCVCSCPFARPIQQHTVFLLNPPGGDNYASSVMLISFYVKGNCFILQDQPVNFSFVFDFQISDLIQESTNKTPLWQFLSLGYALMLCPFVVVLGGMFFLATALYFLEDRAKAEQE